MKKLFINPECTVVEFDVEDIMTTSVVKPNENELPGDEV